MKNEALAWTLVVILALCVVLFAADLISGWVKKRKNGEKSPEKPVSAPETGKKPCEPPEVSKLDTYVPGSGIGGEYPVFHLKCSPRNLSVLPPTVAVSDEFGKAGKFLDKLAADRASPRDLERLYAFFALVISHNLQGLPCSVEFCRTRWSAMEMADILGQYMRWLAVIVSEKN